MILSEVPLLYANKEGLVHRFAIANDGKFERVNVVTSDIESNWKWNGVDPLAGSASVSSLGIDSFVATLPHENLLSVTLVQGSMTQRFELDLRQQLEGSVIAKVKCFEESTSALKLLVADAKATIYVIILEKDSLRPTRYAKFSIEQLLEDQDIEYSGAELHTTMVDFYSSTKAIVALSPLILTVDLDDPSVFVWSETHVQELMSASIGSILGRASSMLLGRVEKIDMAPVTALSSTENCLFSLHADAKVRQWKLDSRGYPTEVYLVDFRLPEKWATTLAPFSFCISAQTYPGSIAAVVHIQTSNSGSSLHLIQSNHDGSRQNVKVLNVPEDISSIVTLALQPGVAPKLFAVAAEAEQGTIQIPHYAHLVYPSSKSGLNPNPLVASVGYTLDGIADEELERISAISDDDVNRVDSLFLRHIFRPAYPRGTGGIVGPSRATIESAISQHLNSYTFGGSNVELETLKAMQQWRRTEQNMVMNKRNPYLYNSIAGDESDVADFEDPLPDEAEAHTRRWKSFVTTLWQHEASMRDPLCITALPDGKVILMRTNVVSILQEGTKKASASEFDVLDESALNLLSKVEAQKPDNLYAVEAGLWEVVASCSLVLEDHHDDHVASEIQNLGLWAQSGSFAKTQLLLKKMTPRKIQDYLETVPRDVLLPGLSKNWMPTTVTQGIVPTPEIRQAAAGIVVRGLDAARRLFVGRCLLLLTHFNEESVVHDMVFTKYLHTLATLWAFSQHVAVPAISVGPAESFGESPPAGKKLSFADEFAVSVLPGRIQRTSVLDAHLIQISTRISSEGTLDDLVTTLAIAVLDATFRKPRDFGSHYDMLPELGCLPVPSKAEIASDYPRVALRLLATSSKAALEMPNAATIRTEAIAECLLIEANHNALQAEHIRRRATSLLDPAAIGSDGDAFDASSTYDALISSSRNLSPIMDMMEAEQIMMKELQHMLYGYVDGAIRQDVRRLCEKESLRMAFLPYFCGGGLPEMNSSQKKSVDALLRTLLQLSNLMNRLSIIERRTDRLGRLTKSDSNSLNLVLQTGGTIHRIEGMFLESTYKTMPEYVGLWSLLFRHAEAARDWTTAVDACIKNPNPERRLVNFKQLVKGMVSAGALGDLLTLCAHVKDADLYEMAADVLAQDAMGDRYNSSSKKTDALGCSYSLHANSGHWKRAAQVMDLRFGDAERALFGGARSSNDGRAIRDLSLSALASFIAIQLVSVPAESFIVAGEFGPYPSITLVDDVEEVVPKSILKRGRDRQTTASHDEVLQSKDDRLSRFMTANDLRARAVRSVAFETLFFDSAATPLSTSALSRPRLAVDIETSCTLASFGYFPLAFAVAEARAVCYAEKSGSTMINGNDLLDVVYSDVVCRYLVGLATECDAVRGQEGGAMKVDQKTSRPTLFQLQYALDAVRGIKASGTCSYVSGPRNGPLKTLPRATIRASAKELIRQIVLDRDSAATPIALKVARAFLDLSDAQLPCWLDNHLAGTCDQAPGLFGNTFKGKSRADASALCTMYMQYGRYVDACNLVTRVLTCGETEGNTRKALSFSRVPEKGDIDFVPYKKIDLLWDLVDRALRQGSIDESTKSKLRVSRLKMEEALKLHFTLLKISEEGLKSARALAT